MTNDLRQALLARYGETQARSANPDVYEDIRSFWPYYDTNYGRLVGNLAIDVDVLEIGCGHGSLLAWLSARGFRNISGVDASPMEVQLTNSRLESPIVVEGDAVAYLEEHLAAFDVVFAKAVVEHIPRDDLLPLVRALSRALRPGGMAIIDVPIMDWLMASHERYMDMTHENGFTRESLSTLLALGFDEVVVTGSKLAAPTRSQRLLRPIVLRMVSRMLYLVGEGASDVLFSSRSLIAVAQAPRPIAS